MKADWEYKNIKLYHNDSESIKDELKFSSVISDPPYGVNWDTDYTRFSGPGKELRKNFRKFKDDSFDPSIWINYPKLVLFGFNCFSDKLPIGSLLIWLKRRDRKLGKFLSDCEMAWMKGGHGIYLKSLIWDGYDKETERGIVRIHPTQKPIEIMSWCLDMAKVSNNDIVCDPYMGSGTTIISCIIKGISCIGIERDQDIFNDAVNRIEDFLARKGIQANPNRKKKGFFY